MGARGVLGVMLCAWLGMAYVDHVEHREYSGLASLLAATPAVGRCAVEVDRQRWWLHPWAPVEFDVAVQGGDAGVRVSTSRLYKPDRIGTGGRGRTYRFLDVASSGRSTVATSLELDVVVLGWEVGRRSELRAVRVERCGSFPEFGPLAGGLAECEVPVEVMECT